MPFPPAFLDELRARLPLSGIAGKKLRLLRAGREFKACCPFHKEKTPSFYINDEKQFYHCFGCGAHGDVIGFTMRMDNLSFPEAIEHLAAQAGLAVPKDTPAERSRYDLEKRLYQLHETAAAWFEEQLFAPIGHEALHYLRSRGLSEEAIRRFHLGYAPSDGQTLMKALTGKSFTLEEIMTSGLVKKSTERNEYFSFFRNRIMFPVGDKRGRTVAFGGRILGEGEPKYLNSPDHTLFHKGKLLYGLSRARVAVQQNQPIIVVEGYMDVISLVEAGYIGTVAPLGTSLTENQLSILWRLLPPPEARDPARDYSPILCFDGDNAGRRAAIRAVERILPMLTSAQTIRIAYLPEGEDPDSLLRQSGRSGMQTVLDQAKPMVEVIWNTTIEGRRLQTPEERGAFINAIHNNISRIQDETLRKLYNDEIQKRLSAVFQWHQKRLTIKTRSGMTKKNTLRAMTDFVSRKKPPKASFLREKVLLVLMINHPALFAEFGDEFARISFLSPSLEALRQQIVDILSSDSHEPLDASELYRHLSDGKAAKSLRGGLPEMLREVTSMYAFAKIGSHLDQAKRGWKSIWNKYLQELLQSDLQAAKRSYTEEASDANLSRLMALREQIEALMHDSSLHEAADNDFA